MGRMPPLWARTRRVLCGCTGGRGDGEQTRLLLATLSAAAKTVKQTCSRPERGAWADLRPTRGPTAAQEGRREQHGAGQRMLSAAERELLPSRMPFEAMYDQLEQWRSAYGTSIVPHHCFDAAELGAWVRSMRRLQRNGRLELWKFDRLNQLGFLWEVSKDEAKWHANLHHLRQFKALHGASAVPFDDGQHAAWRELGPWLSQQGMLLAAGQLPRCKQESLAAVGVTLHVMERVAGRSVRLQGLNAHERRLAKKRWKAEDAAQEEIAQEQQAAARTTREQVERQRATRRRTRRMMHGVHGGQDDQVVSAHDVDSGDGQSVWLLEEEQPRSRRSSEQTAAQDAYDIDW